MAKYYQNMNLNQRAEITLTYDDVLMVLEHIRVINNSKKKIKMVFNKPYEYQFIIDSNKEQDNELATKPSFTFEDKAIKDGIAGKRIVGIEYQALQGY